MVRYMDSRSRLQLTPNQQHLGFPPPSLLSVNLCCPGCGTIHSPATITLGLAVWSCKFSRSLGLSFLLCDIQRGLNGKVYEGLPTSKESLEED